MLEICCGSYYDALQWYGYRHAGCVRWSRTD